MLVLVAAALAYDPDSLRAEATFGLFRDEYDYLQEPATLGHQDGRHVYTLLGNQGGATRLSLGYLGAVGPGVLGGIADGSVIGGEESTTSTTAPTPAAGETVTVESSVSRVHQGAAFVGYGLPVSERLSLGAGFAIEARRWDASLTPVPGGSPSVGGTLTNVSEDGDSIRKETGTYEALDTSWQATVGVAVAIADAELEVDARLQRSVGTMRAEATYITDTVVYTLEGRPPDASLDEGLAAWLPGVAADLTAPLGANAAVRVFAEGAAGPATLTGPDTEETLSDYTDPAAPVDVFTTTRLSPTQMLLYEGEALVALHVGAGATEVRAGVAVAVEGHDLGASSSSQTEERLREVDERYVGLSTPVAVEVAASPRWRLRVGGRFVHARLHYDGSDRVTSEAGEGEIVAVRQQSDYEQSYVEFAVGTRFEVSPAFALDASAGGTGAPDGDRVSINLGNLLVSGVLRFP